MSLLKVYSFMLAVGCWGWQVQGHGLIWDPPNRSSLWRLVPGLPINTEDNQLFCGGKTTQWELNNGKCGACGDNYADSVPRANENGGHFGTGRIAKTYYSGTSIEVKVNLTASHKGHFLFNICDSGMEPETEECFDKMPLMQVDGTYPYYITPEREEVIDQYIYLQLPQNFTCDRCTLRWHYWTSNSVGMCDDGQERPGCGAMETFRSCSDIKIIVNH